MPHAYLKKWAGRKVQDTEGVMMTREEAQERAARLGLSTWVDQAIAVGPKSRAVDVMCVGFASAEFPIAVADTWEEALDMTMRIIFGTNIR